MVKVVYEAPKAKVKRYVVQFKPEEGYARWVSYDESFRFKWAAILFTLISPKGKYEERVIDTYDISDSKD